MAENYNIHAWILQNCPQIFNFGAIKKYRAYDKLQLTLNANLLG